MKMFLTRILFNSVIVVDFAIIIDILNHNNIQHSFILGPDTKTAVSIYKILHGTNMRFSIRNKYNSTLIIPHSYQKVGVILNTSSKDWESVFDSFNKANAFRSPFFWTVVTEDLDRTIEVLSQYPIEVNSDVTIIYKKDGNYSLYDIYNTGFYLNGEVIVRSIGFWNGSLHIIKQDRLNLKGLMLRTTVVITKNQRVGHKTFIEFLDLERPRLQLDSLVDSIHKLKYYEILKYYRDMFNISFKFQRTLSWGYPTNGTFDGMVGSLQRFESDIGGSPLFVRTDRAMAVDYAAETWQTRPCFIFRHPKHPSGFYTIYTRPLSTRVWYCIIAVLFLFTVILERLLRMKSIQALTDEKEESASLALLFVWGAICQQGMSIRRRSTTVKIVVFVLFIFALTLYQYYNALVVSTLLQAPPKNIRTMEDLLKSNLKAGCEDLLYNKDFFKRTTDPLAITMYHKRIVTDTEYNFYPAEVGMASVKRGGYAFHVDRAVAYRIMQNTFTANELCDATEIPMYKLNTGAAVAKQSPYKEHIAYGIRKMKERGIMHRLQLHWDVSKPVCVRTPDSGLITVSLLEFQTALILLSVGILAAVVVLYCEIMIHAKKPKLCFYPNCQLRKLIEFRN